MRLKKFISILIITSLFFNLLNIYRPKIVYASDIAMPVVAEALDGTGLEGTTLGSVLAMVMSLALVGETTYIAWQDVKDPATSFYKFLDEKKDDISFKVKDWFDRLCEQTVWLQDTSMTLVDYLFEFPNSSPNIWEFIFPKDIPVNVKVTRNVSQYVRNWTTTMFNLPGIKPGIYSSAPHIFLNLLKEVYVDYDNIDEIISTFMSFDFGELFMVDSNKEFVILGGIVPLGSSNEGKISNPYLGIYDTSLDSLYLDTKYHYMFERYMTVLKGYPIAYISSSGDLSFQQRGDEYFRDYNSIDIKYCYSCKADEAYFVDEDLNFLEIYQQYLWDQTILWSSCDLKIENIYLDGLFVGQPYEQTILPSQIEYINRPLETDDVNEIVLTPEVVNEYADRVVDIGNMISSDSIANEIAIVDNIVRKKTDGEIKAITNEITVVGEIDPTIPDEGTDTSEYPFPLDWLINGLKGLFEWLFVPSSLAIENAVTHCKAKMDSQAGLLSYPLTLVIKFLLAVGELETDQDCIMVIPPIIYKNNVLYEGTSFNLTQFIKDNGFSTIQNMIYAIGNFIMIVGLLNMAKNKGDELLTGGLK